ncbi:hypothetical protein KP509_31G054900 [Ceratopteris richardii]|nr:hypothetical protein KP509_31G054900 [Ceratopteris richardii]KAH7289035.1 hypothetical protein KP509_31G054900 [Ceratopteris richardii]
MQHDWELSELIRTKWQHDASEYHASQQFFWSYLNCSHQGKLCSGNHNGTQVLPDDKDILDKTEKNSANGLCISEEENGCASFKGEEDDAYSNKEQDISLSTYRLHVENPDDDVLGMRFSSPLILNKTLLEQKLNCCGRELQNVEFLNLNHEGLSSMGKSVLKLWCPRVRILTADMNRLNNLQNAFSGYEENLEQLSLKDNFLCDLSGLECLHKLQVMHLDGNYLLNINASALNFRDNSSADEVSNKTDTAAQRKDGVPLPIPLGSAKCLPPLCWPSLRELGVSCNRISKVEKLGLLCPNLEVLDLGSNNLASLGWSQEGALFGLSCLRVLDVGQNRLKGSTLWDNLRHCPLLLSVVASRNQLEDLPTHHGNVFLRELWLNGNSIKCFSCTAWLPNLQRLYLQDNEIDTLAPIWGMPALEVLDLSFNKISQLHQLHQLGCFFNLRSLQLNDNPIAESSDYLVKVLEAVPWLVELDNEPLTDLPRLQAVQSIFSKIMSTVGLCYVRSNILKGKLPCPGVLDINYDNKMHHEKSALPVNQILAGDADLNVLWSILIELYDRYIRTNFGKRKYPSSLFVTECQWKLQSLQLMCIEQKRKLINSLRQSATLKRGIEDFCEETVEMPRYHIQNNRMSLTEQCTRRAIHSKNGYIIDLECCLWEHVRFNGCSHEETIFFNEDYKLEELLYNERVSKVQALVKGFLVRRKFKSRTLHLHDQIHISQMQWETSNLYFYAALKIQSYWKRWMTRRQIQRSIETQTKRIHSIIRLQALWRGFRTRKRFQFAIRDSKHEDHDDFECLMAEETKFLQDIFQLQHLDSTSTGSELHNRFDIRELPISLHHYFGVVNVPEASWMLKEEQIIVDDCKDEGSDQGKSSGLLVEKKAAIAEITKDWGFSDEKTAWQLIKAMENTRKQPRDILRSNSQTRYNAFISKCVKNTRNTSCSLGMPKFHHNNVQVIIRSSTSGRTQDGLQQSKQYVAAPITTLEFNA